MKSCNNNSSCNNGYQYPKQTTAEDTALITFWNGCRYVGVSAKDFITAAKLGFYDNLDGLQDGDVLMFQDNEVVASGLRYDPETDALVYTGKLIADEIEVSTETIFISQRIAIEAFGNSVEFKDNFNEERRLPIYTKISEQGSLGNFAAQVGAEQPITIQGDSSENYTSFSYSPPVTEGQVNASNSTRGHYRFSVGGINARIKVTATNAEGQEFVQFGTEAYPYKQFVTVAYDGTEATETIVEYPGGIYNTEGLTYTTVIETYDPDTREISTEPLNILGSTASGVFRAYVLVDFQTVTEVELSGQGDVIGAGPVVIGDIPVYSEVSGKAIATSGFKPADFVKVTDPLNKQSTIIIANTVDIYEPDDLINRYFYEGLASALVKLKNPNDEYSEQDRFQVYNDTEFTLIIAESDDTELQVIQNGQAYEFFYIDNEFFTGWQVEKLTLSDQAGPYTGAVPPPSTDNYWALNTNDRRSYTYNDDLSKWVSRYESVVMQKRGRLNPSNYINIGEVTPSDVDKGLAGGINQLADGLDYGTVIVAIAYVNGRDNLPVNAEFELWVSDGTGDKELKATFSLADPTAPNGMAFPDAQFIMNHTDVYAIKYQGNSQVNDIVLTVYYEAVYDA